jgi:Putative Ig domain/CHAP domain
LKRLALVPAAALAAGVLALPVLVLPVLTLVTVLAVPAAPTLAAPALARVGGVTSDRSRGFLVGGSCAAVAGAYQLPGAHGVAPAAWTGDGLTVPACGPIPDDGGPESFVSPYPESLWTPGYQCVEFSERYLYYRFGVTMDIPTNGDQVAAHYAARYPGLFTVVANGTAHRAPVPGDVLSMSADLRFDSRSGGHTAVVQGSSVNAAGDGTVTIVEENAVRSGVEVLQVRNWYVSYRGFPYLRWLTTIGLLVTTPWLPAAAETRPYSVTLTATGGRAPYRWALTQGTLPAGLALSAAGVLSGTPDVDGPGDGDDAGTWPVTVSVSDGGGAAAVAVLNLVLSEPPADYYCLLIAPGASCSGLYSPM